MCLCSIAWSAHFVREGASCYLGWGGASLWRGDGSGSRLPCVSCDVTDPAWESSCPHVRLVVFLLGVTCVAATAGAAGRLSRVSTAASEGSEAVSVQGSRAHRRSLIGALASAEVPSAADVQEVCVVAIFRCERLSVVGLVLVFRFWCWFLMLWCWCWCLAFSDVFCASSIPAPPGRSQCEHALSHCGVHVWLCVPRSRARWSGRRVQRRTYRRCPSGRRAVLRGTCHNPHWVPWREVSVCWWWSHFWLASACLFAAPPPRHGWFEWCSLGGAG